MSEHGLCQHVGRGSLPKRVLDVGYADGSQNPVLIENVECSRLPYATLSHCWGSSVPLCTTSKTLSVHLSGLEWSALPASFQDAITVTRWLNVRYLWVDSLCILQDDPVDWEEQSAKMASIYEGSYITLAATCASSCTEGFLSQRQQNSRTVCLDMYKNSYQIRVRTPIEHREFFHGWYHGNPYPLFNRAWVLQERVLAARVIHFTKKELVFECRNGSRCECGNEDDLPPMLKQSLGFRFENDDSLDLWHNIVANYTSMRMTHDGDILPALSAIASSISPLLGDYKAGMWKDYLLRDLMWCSIKFSKNPPQRRPQVYTAPSFSWASIVGNISWDRDLRCLNHSWVAQVSDIQVGLRCHDAPFGAVCHGSMTMKGQSLKAKVVGRLEVDHSVRDKWLLEVGNQTVPAYLDVPNEVPDSPECLVTCLGVCKLVDFPLTDIRISLLILKPSSRVNGFFERIGISEITQETFMDNAEDTTITIV